MDLPGAASSLAGRLAPKQYRIASLTVIIVLMQAALLMARTRADTCSL